MPDQMILLLHAGSGMTDVINKFQRILGLKYCGKISGKSCIIGK